MSLLFPPLISYCSFSAPHTIWPLTPYSYATILRHQSSLLIFLQITGYARPASPVANCLVHCYARAAIEMD